MKKILLATTLLAGTAGFASAEVTISGSGVFGLGWSEDAAANPFGDADKTYAIRETYLTFTGVTTTDGGLELGVVTTFGTYNTDNGIEDDGSYIYASGAFGKLSMGAVDEADEVAALADIGGLSGLGVDNVAEALSGDSESGLAHNVHYTYSAGALTFSASALLGKDDDSMAVGVKYSFGDAYVGLGYADHQYDVVPADDFSVTSVYAGGTFGDFGVKAMYSEITDGLGKGDSAWGLFGSYTTGALTLNAEVADNDYSTKTSYGIGASYDLGGGAAVVGGIASVDDNSRAELGLSFEF